MFICPHTHANDTSLSREAKSYIEKCLFHNDFVEKAREKEKNTQCYETFCCVDKRTAFKQTCFQK